MNTETDLAAMFKALGDPTRLHIFDFLRSCCCPVAVEETGDVRPLSFPAEGAVTVGDICCHITGDEKVTSRISFHLKELRLAGLITTERRGKHIICGVDPRVLEKLAAYFGGKENANACGCD